MQCPNDKTEMIRREVGGVQVEECPQCKGTWFEQTEFQKAKDSIEPDAIWLDFEIWKHEDQFKLDLRGIECPLDGAKLVALVYGETGVEVNYCTQCHGIWLDGGEFEKIVKALDDELTSMSTSEYLSATPESSEVIQGLRNFRRVSDLMTILRHSSIGHWLKTVLIHRPSRYPENRSWPGWL
jgi:Zn-finger nucleic acid-binding protein